MAQTRGAKSSFPVGHKRVAREAPVQGSTSEPPRQVAVPPLVEPAPLSPPARRYQTRSGGRPPQKKPKVVDSKPIDLTEPSPEPFPEPSPAPFSEPPVEPQPPIEGNLDCQARPFHSELCFHSKCFACIVNHVGLSIFFFPKNGSYSKVTGIAHHFKG